MKKTSQSRSTIEAESKISIPLSGMSDINCKIPLARSSFVRSKLLGFSSGVLCSLLAATAGGAPAAAEVSEPDIAAPWPQAEKAGLWPKGGRKPALEATGTTVPTAKPVESQAPATSSALPDSNLSSLKLKPAPKNEISVSADFLLGQGNVTLPIGFSLVKYVPVPPGSSLPFPTVSKADRQSDYIGATASYSFGRDWYFDASYAKGQSSGNVPIAFGPSLTLPSDFSIDDNAYQLFVRYTFPRLLRTPRLSAYVRAGVSYVQAELSDVTTHPNFGVYTQHDKTEDILGNLGFGVSYALWVHGPMRLQLQVEGEGFYGNRSQDSLESITSISGVVPVPANIDNTLYGGLVRATLRFQYAFGQEKLFKFFIDGGVAAKFTQIEYPDVSTQINSPYSELLWGPYAKIGIRYSF